jgi:hypothetical protein
MSGLGDAERVESPDSGGRRAALHDGRIQAAADGCVLESLACGYPAEFLARVDGTISKAINRSVASGSRSVRSIPRSL